MAKRGKGERRSKTEREEDLHRTAVLDRRGYSCREIAAELKVDAAQVTRDLKLIRDRYAEATLLERGAAVAEKVEQLREQRAELWRAWERSKDNKERQVQEQVTDMTRKVEAGAAGREEVEKLKSVLTTEGRLPDASYQRLVLDNLAEESKLRALYPAKAGGDTINGPSYKIYIGTAMEDV